ncbi:two-component sensor histidine kinase [Amorphoplanes auranticolor]|uniref:histidine kinase n=2 Tax=Actinoplanes auranticolor TaxID=47988 RepID=A0A919W1Y4_9ACTN|nr:two-component sensor histidine kinase [Actinoplanes auranticolor]
MPGGLVGLIRRRLPGATRQILIDGALAVPLCALDLAISWSANRRGDLAFWVVPGYAIAGYLILAIRRRYPIAVFAVVVIHSASAGVFFAGFHPTIGVWWALYTVAYCKELRVALLCLPAVAVPMGLNIIDAVDRQPPDRRIDALIGVTVGLTLFNAIAFGVGRWVRWAGRQRRLAAEHAAADAVAEERARIARDLHDIVAHAITMMLLQAGGAARWVRPDPARAEQALGHVDALGQQAIVDLRRMLDLMRVGRAGEPPEPSALPGLNRLAELVNHMRSDDLPVELACTGQVRALPPGTEVCAYRILQEALTNATRYAERGTVVRVAVDWQPSRIVLSVHNRQIPQGRAHRRLGTGHGILNMQERAHSVGGRVTANPAPGGVFVVRAVLPVAAETAVDVRS